MLNRRDFLTYGLTASSLTALGCTPPPAPVAAAPEAPAAPPPAPAPVAPAAPAPAAPPGKTLLILGGTSFLGPAIVDVAKARGYKITLFNRGKTRPELFPDLEKLHGDRDPNKGEGLKQLEGRKWDAVIDTSGYYPRIVKASATLLAPNVKQYVFISSVSAFAENATPGADETAPAATLADPTVETMGKEFENYGGLKALCEQAAEAALPGRVANVRPGYIVGPGDPTDRFTYWPLRVEKGGEVLAPGTAADPVQIIDVRDLAAFVVGLVEAGTMGLYNALGPAEPLSMGRLLESCKQVTGSDARFTWVSAKWIEEAPGDPIDLPIWVPPEGKTKGFHLRSFEKARKAGLRHRSVDETVQDTLAWWKTLPQDRQEKRRAGISADREKELLEAFKKPKGKKPAGAKPAKKP